MAATLAELRARALQILSDTGSAIYTADLVDECLRHALADYSAVLPQELETVVTLVGDGREVDLSALTGLLGVTQVYWPWDSLATEETWPPNQVRGWRLVWDDASPILHFTQLDGDQPQADDEVRIWYAAKQTINGLDGETATTVRLDHETLIVLGGAAYAALARAQALIETAGVDLYQVGLLGSWGQKMMSEFRARLAALRGAEARRGPTWVEGWSIDKWDRRETESNF